MHLSRRAFFRAAGLTAAAAMAPSFLTRSAFAAEAQKKGLNVLFIAVDDLRPELACYGAKQIVSPNLDRLAETGAIFERAYCQQAVCAPSRASLLTGCRPDTTKVTDLKSPVRTTCPQLMTLPRHFRENGYHVSGMGKIYHHGPTDDASAWSEPYAQLPSREKGRGYVLPENQPSEAEAGKPPWSTVGPAWEKADVPDNAYHDGALADEAIRQLQQSHDRPFFMALGLLKPHLPFCAPSKYWDMYDPSKIELDPNPLPPKGTDPIALHNFGELRGYTNIPKGQQPISEDLARSLIHGYYASVSYTDAQIGRVLDALEKTGQADNTVVVVWGDHGWHLGDHGLWCKHSNFEKAAHSPLIVRMPGMPKGQRSKALVEFVDVFPFLCDACGLAKPEQLEGSSFMPLLADPNRPWKKAAFSLYPRGREGEVLGRSVRTERYRFTRWGKPDATGLAGITELYDYQTDPLETVNLAADEANKGLVLQMAKVLDAGWKAALP